MSSSAPFKTQAFAAVVSLALAIGWSAADAKGCIKGAAVGAVAGHVAGHHAVLGAAAGCVVGHHIAKKKQRKERRLQQSNTAQR
jgi:hypothetical protein